MGTGKKEMDDEENKDGWVGALGVAPTVTPARSVGRHFLTAGAPSDSAVEY